MKCDYMATLRCPLLLIACLAYLQVSEAAFRFSARISSRVSSSSVRSIRSYGISRGGNFATLGQLVRTRFSYRISSMAYTRGIFFAPLPWRTSHSYSDAANLCFNVMDALPSNYNSSVLEPWLYQSRTVLGVFVCPMEENAKDRTYCCGDEDRQRCCTFWDDAGRVAGLFCGLGALVVTLAIITYYVRRWFIRNKVEMSSKEQDAPADPVAAATPHQQQQMISEAPMNASINASLSEPPDIYPPPPTNSYPNAGNLPVPAYPMHAFGRTQADFGTEYVPPPYPGFAPPSYWDANNGDSKAQTSGDSHMMPPMRS